MATGDATCSIAGNIILSLFILTVNKYKSLAIISDCVHVFDKDGTPSTENHIFCRQMQELASRFERTVIVCPFVPMKEHFVISIYTLPTIRFIPLENVGGSTVKAKLGIAKMIPAWMKAFIKANKQSDVVYLRMPNNLSIPAFFYFKAKRKKWFATYTGTWANYKGEPATYRFQKWLLKNFFGGPVSVYVNEEPATKYLHKGISPSYNEAEWHEETQQVTARLERYRHTGIPKPVFVTVGALVPNKNQQYVLETCKRLSAEGFLYEWYIVGDGYMKEQYQQYIDDNNLGTSVFLAGKKTYEQLRVLYRKADFLVQPTLVEGFGKVPIEAMFHGVIPVLSKTALSNEMTGNGKHGFIFDVQDKEALYALINSVLARKESFAGIINNGRNFVKQHTLEHWADTLIKQINA